MKLETIIYAVRLVLFGGILLLCPGIAWPILLGCVALAIPVFAGFLPNPLDEEDDGKILELTDPRVLPFGLIMVLEIGAWGGALTGALVLRMAA